jgi:hypothetical protein
MRRSLSHAYSVASLMRNLPVFSQSFPTTFVDFCVPSAIFAKIPIYTQLGDPLFVLSKKTGEALFYKFYRFYIYRGTGELRRITNDSATDYECFCDRLRMYLRQITNGVREMRQITNRAHGRCDKLRIAALEARQIPKAVLRQITNGSLRRCDKLRKRSPRSATDYERQPLLRGLVAATNFECFEGKCGKLRIALSGDATDCQWMLRQITNAHREFATI